LVGLGAIVAVGAFLRVWRLDTIPAGLFFDVAANLFDVVDVLDGARPIWFSRNNGREPLVIYAEAVAALFFGPTALAAKAATAGIGIAAIPACYVLGREVGAAIGGVAARRLGLITAFLIATLYWHVNFSRIGLRTIALPLFLALGIGLLLRALRTGGRTAAVLAGATTGMAVYTYLSSRLTPLFLVPALIALWLAWRRPTRLLGLYVGASAVVVAPFLYHYVRHRGDLESRAASISVLNPDISGGDPVGAGFRGMAVGLASLVWRGTPSGMENLPNRPLFEPVTGAMFLLGCALLAVMLVRRDPRRRAVALLVALWVLVMMLPVALSVDPPNFSRITGVVAAGVLIAALGYERLIAWARPAALLLAVPLLWTTYDYFVIWAPSEVAYRYMMEDKVQGAARIERWLASGERVFLAPLYAKDWTYLFLLRDDPVESFDVGAAQVIPPDGPVRYAFPPDDPNGLATVAERLGRGRVEMFADASGRFPLLSTLVVDGPAPPAAAAPLGRFEDGIELVDVEPAETRLRAGEALRLRLGWRAYARPSREYTVFVHGRDGAHVTQFQRDRRPGDGSAPTTGWRAGDRVDDYIDVAIPRDLPAGEYRVVVGMYDRGNGQRLALPEVPGRPNELAAARVTIAQ
jgi:hypothetical protein